MRFPCCFRCLLSPLALGFYGACRTCRGVLRSSRQAMGDKQRHGAFDRNMCDPGLLVQPPISVQNFFFPKPLIIELPALVRFEPGERKFAPVFGCWMTRVGVGG